MSRHESTSWAKMNNLWWRDLTLLSFQIKPFRRAVSQSKNSRARTTPKLLPMTKTRFITNWSREPSCFNLLLLLLPFRLRPHPPLEQISPKAALLKHLTSDFLQEALSFQARIQNLHVWGQRPQILGKNIKATQQLPRDLGIDDQPLLLNPF